MSLGVVRDGVGITADVGAKLVNALAERLDARVGGGELLEVVDKTVDAGQRIAVIAVPQVPLDAFQLPFGRLRLLLVVMGQPSRTVPAR